MQFLTSAFLLPYLVSRTAENVYEDSKESSKLVYLEEADSIFTPVSEDKLFFAPLLGLVGTGSIVWGLFGRMQEFGGFQERYASLVDLLSIDRVGSSFIVDLVIFGLFQGWLVDDDLRRRGVDVDNGEEKVLSTVAKFLPFFGLIIYFSLRPSFQPRSVELLD